MKNIMTILITAFVSSTAFAGNGGGTMMGAMTGKDSDIVFNIGLHNADQLLAHGKLIDGQWQIEKIKLPTQVIIQDPKLKEALELSKDLNQWIEIK